MVGTTECFKIRLSYTTGSELSEPWRGIEDQPTLLEIHFEKNFFSKNPIIIVADPFLFVHNGELFLFYEEKRLCTPGVLRMIKTSDLKKWSEPVTVLDEPFHLSYPFVFEDNGEVYMIPETSASGEVRLYRASKKELTAFEQVSVLLTHNDNDVPLTIDYSDSSICRCNNTYYLISSINEKDGNQLLLYSANSLFGPYTKHPCSPLIKSMKYGRDAGCISLWNGKLYRFAQDCEKRYGDNVHVFEINELSQNNYMESLVSEHILKENYRFYKRGGHQLNYVEFQGMLIVATDAKEYRYYLKYLLDRISSKI